MSRVYQTPADCAADQGHTRIKVDYATWMANTVPLPTTGLRTLIDTGDPSERAEYGHCDVCNSSLIYVYPKQEAA